MGRKFFVKFTNPSAQYFKNEKANLRVFPHDLFEFLLVRKEFPS